MSFSKDEMAKVHLFTKKFYLHTGTEVYCILDEVHKFWGMLAAGPHHYSVDMEKIISHPASSFC
jgi:hypothetical protein